jgi:hypothetical protein
MTEPHADQQQANNGHTLDPDKYEAATPAWMQMSTKPLEAALSGKGRDHLGLAATLWPFGQDSDITTRAGRYMPDTSRHSQRTRAALTAYVIDQHSRPGRSSSTGSSAAAPWSRPPTPDATASASTKTSAGSS